MLHHHEQRTGANCFSHIIAAGGFVVLRADENQARII
jgi:hypothetical protein